MVQTTNQIVIVSSLKWLRIPPASPATAGGHCSLPKEAPGWRALPTISGNIRPIDDPWCWNMNPNIDPINDPNVEMLGIFGYIP